MNERSQPLRTMASAGEPPDAGWHWAGRNARDMASGEAHMSLMGSRERSDEGVPGTGSPTAVVQQEVGDHLATRQIEAVEVRQPVEVAALEHGTALARVVEADHRGQEHAFPAAPGRRGRR